MTTIETRTVYPNAEVRTRKNNYSVLYHACEVDAEGNVVRVLCGKVKVDNMEERAGMNGLEYSRPTCLACLARDPRSVLE